MSLRARSKFVPENKPAPRAGVTLFCERDSLQSHWARLVLAEKEVEGARIEWTNPGKPSEDLLVLNPQLTLPTLTDRDVAIHPARVIVEYLDERYPHPRLMPADLALFETLHAYDPIWVRGNHDGDFVPPGFTAHDEIVIDTITFRHEAGQPDRFEISGHYHPKADITHKGARLSRRAFIHDAVRMIMPAFGSYAGGLSVTDQAIAGLFPKGYRLHVLGTSKVFALDMPEALERKVQ